MSFLNFSVPCYISSLRWKIYCRFSEHFPLPNVSKEQDRLHPYFGHRNFFPLSPSSNSEEDQYTLLDTPLNLTSLTYSSFISFRFLTFAFTRSVQVLLHIYKRGYHCNDARPRLSMTALRSSHFS